MVIIFDVVLTLERVTREERCHHVRKHSRGFGFYWISFKEGVFWLLPGLFIDLSPTSLGNDG